MVYPDETRVVIDSLSPVAQADANISLQVARQQMPSRARALATVKGLSDTTKGADGSVVAFVQTFTSCQPIYWGAYNADITSWSGADQLNSELALQGAHENGWAFAVGNFPNTTWRHVSSGEFVTFDLSGTETKYCKLLNLAVPDVNWLVAP